MNLNEASGSGEKGERGTDLVVTPADKRAAASYIEEDLGPAAVKKGGQAVTASTDVFGSSNTTPGVLRGWDTRKGLDFCLERWEEAWQNIGHHLRRELAALHGTKAVFQGVEGDRIHDFSRISPGGGSRLNDL
ncbi:MULTISPECIES: hypothetical protein [unclassified Streptomyces]|nr:hypothetical protein [Streptomyces sp. NBC_01775]WSB79545.1 hypothetical protein OHB04_30010 [Streptomyces sp. NBC_01775]WSS40964.1 hypothetical protein OG220_10360 [Streptomyces sp. NBC_01187]